MRDVVFLSLGSNDLASAVPPADVARHIILTLTRLVIIDQALPRDDMKFPGFRQVADDCNAHTRHLLTTGDYPRVSYLPPPGPVDHFTRYIGCRRRSSRLPRHAQVLARCQRIPLRPVVMHHSLKFNIAA